MDLATGRPWWPLADADQFGDAVRHWLGNNWAPSLTVGDWWERIGQAGLAVPTWPRASGGIAATLPLQHALEAELAAAGAVAPPVSGEGIRVVGPALREHGSPDQQQRWLPEMITGRQRWGAAVQDPATADDSVTAHGAVEWNRIVLHGTTRCAEAALADRLLVVVRTGADQRVTTALAVDTHEPSVRVEADEVHFDAVTVPLADVIGQVGGGRAVVRTLLPYRQRSLAGRVRRGLVHVDHGSRAGHLERTIADVLADYRRPSPPPVDRRRS